VNIDEKTKRKIIDLRNQHKKKIREIVSEVAQIVEIVGKSSRDVTAVLKEYKVQQAQTTKYEKKFEKDSGTQNSHDGFLPNVRTYKLFSEGKSHLEVTAKLNLL